jgi:excisionase family DNA binding protein
VYHSSGARRCLTDEHATAPRAAAQPEGGSGARRARRPPGRLLGEVVRPGKREDQGQGLAPTLHLRAVRPHRGGRALLALLGVADVSTSLLSLLTAELEADPELAARYAAALRPHLNLSPTGNGRPSRLDADEAAAILRKSRRTVVRAAAAGRVTGAYRVGRSWRFDPETLALAPPASAKPTPAPAPRPRAGSNSAAAAIRGHQSPERAR